MSVRAWLIALLFFGNAGRQEGEWQFWALLPALIWVVIATVETVQWWQSRRRTPTPPQKGAL